MDFVAGIAANDHFLDFARSAENFVDTHPAFEAGVIALIAAIWVWPPEGSDGGVRRAPGCLTTDLLDNGLSLELMNVIEILAWCKVKEADDFCDFCLVGYVTLSAIHTEAAHQALAHYSLNGTSDEEGLDPHIQQAWQAGGGVIGVERTKYQVAG